MIINGKKEEICSYLSNYHEYLNKGKLDIKLLIDTKNIYDISYMFSGCLSLISLPDISNMNLNNIINIRGFFFCSSLSYTDDISKWKTRNIQDLCGIFQEYSSLRSIPDISRWNTQNVTNMNSLFYKCSN